VAEARPGTDPDALRRGLQEVARNVTGLPAREVVLVPPGVLPKTSSGKLQRSLCRQRYQDGGFVDQPV
jgi:acyl-CoA synthetase (AMP-forming)/AMP-acid ligase II